MARRTWFSPSVLLIVIVGGAVGVALRAAVVVPLGGLSHPLVVPAATLAINLVGAFLLEIIVGRLADHAPRLRFDVARSRFTAHVLARGPEAAARFHDELMRAWGASPGPAWAPWAAAWMFEPGGFWGGHASAMALGARVEPKVVETLRARFDEDWFRNPKAGRGLVEIFDEMRAVGVRAWCDARGGAVPASSSVARRPSGLPCFLYGHDGY